MLEFLADETVQQRFLTGFLVTIKLSGLAATCALMLGWLIAFCRVSTVPALKGFGAAYVSIFRNTPLLIQLFFYYRGLQSIGIVLPPFTCGVLALSLYSGAYLAEVFRSGLLSIPQEQTDAGLALGLSRLRVFGMILVPQAFRIVLPAVSNQLISLVKNSSLVAFITVEELFYQIYKGAVDAFLPVEYFVEGALIYLAISLGISGVMRLIEHWMVIPGQGGEPAYG